MTDQPGTTRFATPMVVVSAGLVLASGLALVVFDIAQAWKALLAIGFVGGAGTFILRDNARRSTDAQSRRSLKRTRLVFIVASVLLASELIFAVARATGWFGADAERWTIQWVLVALAAAAVEMLSSASDKTDKGDKGGR